jgi:drug/metabolite transporter (DMT)-like permease
LSVRRSAAHIPLAAILLIVGAVACFTLLDGIVKYLTAYYPISLLVWARYVVQAVAMVIWLAPRMGSRLIRTRQPQLQLVRGAILIASSVCFVNALRRMPLAEATAINYTTPTLVILLAVVVLKERMTPPRWAFVVAGMAGMLLIVRPGTAILGVGATFALAAALCYAAFQITTRMLAAEDPRVTLFYPALVGSVLMTLTLPFIAWPIDVAWPHVVLILLAGALGTIGHFLFILAFQRAPASGLTPFTYLQIVFATLFGWALFGQFPDGAALAGMAIIGGSGLLLAWHERRTALAAIEEPVAVD